MKQLHISCPVIVLVGPTAIGKTTISIQIAQTCNCEIISMDSMQVYKYMDIGTAKVTDEEKQGIPHYLIDIKLPDQQYDAASFTRDAARAIQSITARGAIPLITGGTGLYLKALTQGLFAEPDIRAAIKKTLKKRLEQEGREALYRELQAVDPKSAKRLHKNDTQRLLRALEIYHGTGISWSTHIEKQQQRQARAMVFSKVLLLGLQRGRDSLYNRINLRSRSMLESGLLDEVRTLRNMGYGPELASMQSIGYRHANQVLDRKADMNQMADELAKDTRRYAKRQLTWFRANQDIAWHHAEAHGDILMEIERFLSS